MHITNVIYKVKTSVFTKYQHQKKTGRRKTLTHSSRNGSLHKTLWIFQSFWRMRLKCCRIFPPILCFSCWWVIFPVTVLRRTANRPSKQQKVKNRNSHHVDGQQIKCFLMSHIENDCRNAVSLQHFPELIFNCVEMNENEYDFRHH